MSNELPNDAKMLWDAIPKQMQERLINNVWCPHCSSATKMVDFEGKVEQGDLVLTGSCVKCGGSVARVIENE